MSTTAYATEAQPDAETLPRWQRRQRQRQGLTRLAAAIGGEAGRLAEVLESYYHRPATVLQADRRLRRVLSDLESVRSLLEASGQDS